MTPSVQSTPGEDEDWCFCDITDSQDQGFPGPPSELSVDTAAQEAQFGDGSRGTKGEHQGTKKSEESRSNAGASSLSPKGSMPQERTRERWWAAGQKHVISDEVMQKWIALADPVRDLNGDMENDIPVGLICPLARVQSADFSITENNAAL